MENRKFVTGLLVVVALLALLGGLLVSNVPVMATDPSPATLVGVPQVRRLEQGDTGHSSSYRAEFDYRDGYAEHAQIELYATTTLSSTATPTDTVTLTVQSSALGANWVSHSDTITFGGSSPGNKYLIFPHRGAKMAVYWTIPSGQMITPTVELVFSNRK